MHNECLGMHLLDTMVNMVNLYDSFDIMYFLIIVLLCHCHVGRQHLQGWTLDKATMNLKLFLGIPL